MKKPGLIAIFILLAIVVVSQNNKEIVFSDDFENYNAGGQLACQNPGDWSTWDIFPCGPNDAHISDMYSYSGFNSVNIMEGNDNYYELNEYLTSGFVNVRTMIYIPSGNSAYFNVLSDCEGGTNPEWAFEIYFNTNGDGYLNAGGSYAATFNYNSGTWLFSELYIDLDADHAYYYIENNLIHDWQWTLGSNGNGGQLQVAAVDFYGIEAASYYFDDFEINDGYGGNLTSPTNLTGPGYVFVGEDINLAWEFPDSGKCTDSNYNIEYFEYFNIYRDGLVIGTSTELEYTDNINISGTYTYCVTAVYDIGESECSNSINIEVDFSLYPPTNLTGYIDDNDVTLNWDAPNGDVKTPIKPALNKDLTGYNVYRDGEVIGTTDETTYTDYDLLPDTYEYCVTAVYDEGESECSNTFTVVGPNPLLPPTNFTGPDAVFFGEPFCFTWDAPGYGEWIHWDSGENTGNGISAGEHFFIASHWMPSDLEAYQGFLLTKMAFFPVGAPNAIFTLKVWTGPNAEIEVMSQDVQAFMVDSWNEVNLSNPIVIEASTEYWFGYEVSFTSGFPAGCDDGPAIQGLGDMISIDGIDWVSMSEAYGLNYNWNLQAYLSYNGKAGTLVPVPKNSTPKSYVGTAIPALQNTNLNSNKEVFIPKNNKELLYYNLYRNGELLGNTDCDTIFSSGTYVYCVTAVYDEGESDCSNEWIIYLWTNINEGQINNIKIFPNPASDIVNIKSDIQINNVKVYNYSWQLIWDKEANDKTFQINTSQFKAGIYFLRIETKDGVISERIVIQ